MLCGAEDHIEFLQRKLGKHATFLSDKASLKTLDLTYIGSSALLYFDWPWLIAYLLIDNLRSLSTMY